MICSLYNATFLERVSSLITWNHKHLISCFFNSDKCPQVRVWALTKSDAYKEIFTKRINCFADVYYFIIVYLVNQLFDNPIELSNNPTILFIGKSFAEYWTKHDFVIYPYFQKMHLAFNCRMLHVIVETRKSNSATIILQLLIFNE